MSMDDVTATHALEPHQEAIKHIRNTSAATLSSMLTPPLSLTLLLLDVSRESTAPLPLARRIRSLVALRRSLRQTISSEESPSQPMIHSSHSSPKSDSSNVGNDFAKVEITVSQHQMHIDNDGEDFDSDDNFDYVSALTNNPCDLVDDPELLADSHFEKRFLHPVPGSAPIRVIILDEDGRSNGFAASLSQYLDQITKASNMPHAVSYLIGGIEALKVESPWLFDAARVISTNTLGPDEIATVDSAFLGWGDEVCELYEFSTPLAVNIPSFNVQDVDRQMAAVSAEADISMMDQESTSTTECEDESDSDDTDALGSTIESCMVDSGIDLSESLKTDDMMDCATEANVDIAADTKTPRTNSNSTATSTNCFDFSLNLDAQFLAAQTVRNDSILPSILKHPQVHFKHLSKSNSPTHDLRMLQQHLIASVWYGKRNPEGDIAVPILHPLAKESTTSQSSSRQLPAQPPRSNTHRTSPIATTQIADFLHLSSCYAAADPVELKKRNIRHVVRLGWGFEVFQNGSLKQRNNESFIDEPEYLDSGDWSCWESDQEDHHDQNPGASALNGVRESIMFFQSLASGVGIESELSKLLTELQAKQETDKPPMAAKLSTQQRARIRKLMGGNWRRVGGADAGMNQKYNSWRVKMYDFPIEDTPAAPIRWILEKCCEVLEAARVLGENVLVHCHAGVSRSSTIVLAYLMRWRRFTLYESWLLTYKARPIIRPNEGFSRALQELEYEMHPHLKESTMPIFWMSDSYTNFLEILEVQERLWRWQCKDRPVEAAAADERKLSIGTVRKSSFISELVAAGPVTAEEEAAVTGGDSGGQTGGRLSVKGRGRGLSFGGRAG
ncbi:hypothetical protein HDU81_005884 [Chytriomyces hyalinus]|nr:hypothetical protein HDU81_005884 [Chytriomyces hyalinus]